MLSFWERESLLQYDYIIIGSGIVGLNAAINLKIAQPKARVVILERGIFPSGASTRNAGFACFGSVAELLDDSNTTSEEDMYHLFVSRRKGIELLRARLGDATIGFVQEGSHELLKASESDVLDKVEYFNALFKDVAETPIFSLAPDIIAKNGFSNRQFRYAIAANLEGSIHTGNMMAALINMCQSLGVTILTGATVTKIHATSQNVSIDVQDTIRNSILPFTAQKVIVCTNAFSDLFFPNMDMAPGRGQVMITQPIPNLQVKGIFHFDKGYYYFRAIDNRILIGGGRNLDFEGECTTAFGSNVRIEAALTDLLSNDILPHQKYEWDMKWSGIMAFGQQKWPILQTSHQRIYGAFRLGGMGVALGAQLAADLTALVLAEND